MAYQQSDLDKLHTTLVAVATGAQEVQFADGRRTKFQTVEAVAAAIAVVDAQLKMQARALGGIVRHRVPYYRSGL
jgi:ribosome biogenesis protein Tsr3